MERTELVWITACEVCGREHLRTETCHTATLEELRILVGRFERRCELWYAEHVESLNAQRRIPAQANGNPLEVGT